jgi:hypothetical protein
MEEKNKKKQEKLSYEDLSKQFGELYLQYQKLAEEYKKLASDKTAFILSSLFKVTEQPSIYKKEFLDWCTSNIEAALTTMVDSMAPGEEPEAKKDEAE